MVILIKSSGEIIVGLPQFALGLPNPPKVALPQIKVEAVKRARLDTTFFVAERALTAIR